MLICYLFDDSHSDKSQVITHYGFELIRLKIRDVEHLFWLTIHMSSLEKCLFVSWNHFLIRWFDLGILSCVSPSCILDVNRVLDISLADIFFHSVG